LTQLGHCGRDEGSRTWSMAPAPACLLASGGVVRRGCFFRGYILG
jgi:hypothetical protein